MDKEDFVLMALCASIAVAFLGNISTIICFIALMFIFGIVCAIALQGQASDNIKVTSIFIVMFTSFPCIVSLVICTVCGIIHPDAPLSEFEKTHYATASDAYSMTRNVDSSGQKITPVILLPSKTKININDKPATILVIGTVDKPDYGVMGEQSLQHNNLGKFLHKWFVLAEGDKAAVVVKLSFDNAEPVYGLTTISRLNHEMSDGKIAGSVDKLHVSNEKSVTDMINSKIQSAKALETP